MDRLFAIGVHLMVNMSHFRPCCIPIGDRSLTVSENESWSAFARAASVFLSTTFLRCLCMGRSPDIRESFLRINTQGMKVTTADAIFTRAEALNLRDIVHELRQHLDASFSDIPDEPLLFVL